MGLETRVCVRTCYIGTLSCYYVVCVTHIRVCMPARPSFGLTLVGVCVCVCVCAFTSSQEELHYAHVSTHTHTHRTQRFQTSWRSLDIMQPQTQTDHKE